MNTLVEVLDALAYSDQRVVFPETGEVLPHRELPGLARSFGRVLANAGAGPGDVVGILVPTSSDWLPVFFGVVVTGAAASALPLTPLVFDPSVAAAPLCPLVEAAQMRYVVAAGPGLAVAEALVALCPGLTIVNADGARQAEPSADQRPPVSATDLAVVQFTSGSTARPKGVVLKHGTAVAGISAINTHIRTTSTDVLVQWLPLFHDMGLVALLCSLLTPNDAHLFSALAFLRDPSSVLRHIASVDGSIVTGPNFSYDMFATAAAQMDEISFRAWRLALNGAETVRAQTVTDFNRELGARGVPASTMYPCFGMAEATLAVTLPRLGAEPRGVNVDRDALEVGQLVTYVEASSSHARQLISLGVPVPGIELMISNGSPLAEGQLGEVCIRGASVFDGYLNDASATAEALRDGWLHSGDIGFLNGGELFIAGRSKEVIIVQGRNFFPDDVEEAVRGLDGIYRGHCLAVARTNEESIVVVAESAVHADLESRAELTKAIRGAASRAVGLSSLQVILVPPRSLPRTTSGKWQRARVRDLVDAYFA
ncbi:acyl-CoA synthetase (AMP-forming)/AMP-acid ligase II [Jatrophihabitans sp. GAS493]|uniref:AMP-binding protein n=1 Tax=Jatrophihabitans sp. GAS493 TaxID=1907575 RepID=UPI000BC0F1B8|nr:AMP-binding protein [Jatrophihabitans sp. GAS493]SOD75009.1 acyl-CoA synthetase (AMP-forming)/AMP-acid ligase II [Jatrophihabitans sp. GAS493]